HRDRIDPGSENADHARDLFFQNIRPQPGQVVALYWPKGREFDCSGIGERLLAEGITCALPVIQEESRELKFARWDERIALAEGPFGIMQPMSPQQWVEPDIVIVPLLAFDQKGYRLGYGGGYYDATLKTLKEKKNAVAVGLAYAQQAVLFGLPREDHDQRLDWVVTPLKAQCFN
ncbi:MAG TPA: 5-formyltetrahydrofolate cyclo-ligase, partial [Micavibrio sp.]